MAACYSQLAWYCGACVGGGGLGCMGAEGGGLNSGKLWGGEAPPTAYKQHASIVHMTRQNRGKLLKKMYKLQEIKHVPVLSSVPFWSLLKSYLGLHHTVNLT